VSVIPAARRIKSDTVASPFGSLFPRLVLRSRRNYSGDVVADHAIIRGPVIFGHAIKSWQRANGVRRKPKSFFRTTLHGRTVGDQRAPLSYIRRGVRVLVRTITPAANVETISVKRTLFVLLQRHRSTFQIKTADRRERPWRLYYATAGRDDYPLGSAIVRSGLVDYSPYRCGDCSRRTCRRVSDPPPTGDGSGSRDGRLACRRGANHPTAATLVSRATLYNVDNASAINRTQRTYVPT